MGTVGRKRSLIIGIAYAGLMLWLLLLRQRDIPTIPYWQHTAAHLNAEPFRTIQLYFRLLLRPPTPTQFRLAVLNLAGNVLLFIPMGWLLPELFPRLRVFYRTILTEIAIIAAVEVAQMLLLVGTCDVDDLMLNTIGAAIGYGLYRLFSHRK